MLVGERERAVSCVSRYAGNTRANQNVSQPRFPLITRGEIERAACNRETRLRVGANKWRYNMQLMFVIQDDVDDDDLEAL